MDNISRGKTSQKRVGLVDGKMVDLNSKFIEDASKITNS